MRNFSKTAAAVFRIRSVLIAAVLALVVLLPPVSASAGTGDLPANATARTWGEGWDCQRGFLESRGSCSEIRVPDNAFLNDRSYGKGWSCHRGYREVDGKCIEIAVPDNGYVLDGSYGDGWACERGYIKLGESCQAINVPANAYETQDRYGRG